MIHRHLNHHRYTLAAIDDIISRGRLADWVDLRKVLIEDPTLMDMIEKICGNYLNDPYAQRYYFWMNYVKELRTAT